MNMNNKKDRSKLPEGWVLCTSKSNPGRKYYFNKKTGMSSWTKPEGELKPNDRKPKINKKEKLNKEKRKKEESPKKAVKRKSDNHNEQGSSKKKAKADKNLSPLKTPDNSKPKCPDLLKKSPAILTPTKSNASKKSPLKCQEPSLSKESQTPGKNTANSRMSQLRAELAADVKREENKEHSPVKTRMSPKIETKTSKDVTASPSVSESKSSTNQSPSSDSIPSAPSPSQFLAANKIISSMKAQLPDEYSSIVKPKDSFAYIEQEICNQISEYPIMKHPATPPQFSEASKLVSAIKSKLSNNVAYKVASEIPVEAYSSANDRLSALRTRLSSDLGDINEEQMNTVQIAHCSAEAMDVDSYKEVNIDAPSLSNSTNESLDTSISSMDVVLVVDTNIFIHELDFIKSVLNSNIKGYSSQPTLLVPWRVINELDRLKDNNNGHGAVCKRARPAMDYLYKHLPESNRIKVQPLRDANSHIYPCESPDDEILNCCLQQADRGKSVILLSNDKNLCSKAIANGVKFTRLCELKALLEGATEPHPDLQVAYKWLKDRIVQLLANILENEMRAKYNNLWQHVLLKAPPWTLADVLQCLLKHWLAVFTDVFPRIQHLFTALKDLLTTLDHKNPNNLKQSEVTNFKEICLEIAKKCQIIPEYMELAKLTVERIQRGSETEDAEEECEQDAEMAVIEAFERLWTVYSSYGAKLSTCVGVEHSLEDKLPGDDSIDDLLEKLPLFGAQIASFTMAIKGVITTEAADASMEEQLFTLETTFKENLATIRSEVSVITAHNLRLFCTKCRNMLQEACTKFSQLTDLLEVCQNTIANC